MFDRLGMLTKTLQGRAQVAKGFRIVRPDRQGRAATADGAFEIAERPIRLRQIGMVNVRVGPERHRPADQLDRASVMALLVMQHAQQMQGLGVFLLARQNLLVQLGGRLPVAPIGAFRSRPSVRLAWSVVQWSGRVRESKTGLHSQPATLDCTSIVARFVWQRTTDN